MIQTRQLLIHDVDQGTVQFMQARLCARVCVCVVLLLNLLCIYFSRFIVTFA